MSEEFEVVTSGSSFEDFLREEGTLEETTERAVKRVLARQLLNEMEKKNISKAQMAREMKTSRTQVDRILDPQNDNVSLSTVKSAASVVGCKIKLELA